MHNATNNSEDTPHSDFFHDAEDYLNEDEEEYFDPDEEFIEFDESVVPAPIARRLNALKIGKQFVRFCGVSFSAFVLDFVILALLTTGFGVHYLISNIISFTISIIYSYILSMRLVYTRRADMNRRKEIILFFVLSFIGLGLNELMMWAFKGLIGIPYLYSKIIAGALGALWNFWSRKTFLDAERWHGGSEPRPSLTDALRKRMR